jgi:spore maturation protein CgeB
VRVVIFCHSLVSDWNHGNAHFLRGIVAELQARGHEVAVHEPRDGWSRQNLLRDHGAAPVEAFRRRFPALRSHEYDGEPDLDRALDGAELVLVHEWTAPALVRAIGERRRGAGFRLFFHDTHHRAVTAPHELDALDLREYDGVLAFGDVIRDLHLERGRTARAWTWHEAADTRVFRPAAAPAAALAGDLIWIGNWGDGERTLALMQHLVLPHLRLGLRTRVHGVRYPDAAQALLRQAGIDFAGWLPNHEVPAAFARFRATIHVPRRPYAERLPGIPTIRVFEALACGIPLVSAWWDGAAALFEPGADFLMARTGPEMEQHLRLVLHDAAAAAELAANGLRTIRQRHSCALRVDELLAIHASLRPRAERLVEAR